MASILALLLNDYSFSLFGLKLTYQFLGLNLLLVSLAFSILSAIDYSISILAPEKGSFQELLRLLADGLAGSKESGEQKPIDPTIGTQVDSEDTESKDD